MCFWHLCKTLIVASYLFRNHRLDHVEDAIADYSRALELEPANATALHNRGALYERLGM